MGVDHGTPLYRQEEHSQTTFVPTEHHCEVTFLANADGIITRYDFAGSKCNPYFLDWGRPKKKKEVSAAPAGRLSDPYHRGNIR
ncbi:hypothetical protein XTPLMG730_2069 [Xanthomonas translucens pv. phlei]|uniref:Uncharacterized protein n=1 Tax=Xanthomonas graminis pv. phlei TaxID=487906 RepID=A0A0K2ZT72_9XANT|nr:hypothetical protein XTPLMG730_2069 [Xanthomonas translucens pv. phlei]